MLNGKTRDKGCYEAKIEESEKAGSHLESNPGHLWLELPVLCHRATTARRPPALTILKTRDDLHSANC